MTIQKHDIVEGLRALGIGEGAKLVLHSSLKSFGFVEGGAEAVIDAVLEAVGPDGTMIVPTMTFGAPFERATSPSLCGAVTEAFRLRPDAIRSDHPTHSVAAIGKDAARLLEGHADTLPNGPASPLGKLAREGGFIVLAGVGHESNTTIHAAQHLAGLPIFTKYREVVVTGPDGVTQTKRVMIPGCSRGFGRLEPYIEAKGAQKKALVGDATVRVLRGADIVSIGTDTLRRHPCALLCDSRDCGWCADAEAILREWR